MKFITKFIMILSLAQVVTNCYGKCFKTPFQSIPLKYATEFELQINSDGVVLIKVNRPWINSNESFYYYVVPRGFIAEKSCKTKYLQAPINRVASLSTTHVAFLEAINKLDVLAGFSNINYVSSLQFKEKVKLGLIKEIGYPINRESVIETNIHALLAYSALGPRVEGIEALTKMNIPIIYMGEYREKHPLGRLEWIKMYGILFDCFKESKTYFDNVEKEYQNLKKIVAANLELTPVIVGYKSGSMWQASGDISDFALLIRDAKGKYVFDGQNKNRMIQVGFESAIKASLDATIWLPNNYWNTKDDIINSDSRYENLKFLSKKIYNNNLLVNENGGNDFWESAFVRPDLLLKDLIAIFHPNIFPNHKLKWYREIL